MCAISNDQSIAASALFFGHSIPFEFVNISHKTTVEPVIITVTNSKIKIKISNDF